MKLTGRAAWRKLQAAEWVAATYLSCLYVFLWNCGIKKSLSETNNIVWTLTFLSQF
jgi:hypothetical protein